MLRVWRLGVGGIAVGLACACAADPIERGTSPVAPADAGTDTPSDAPPYDAGPLPPVDAGDDDPATCQKVDIVMAIDNSDSMTEEKRALAHDVFPAFAEALLHIGEGLEDFRVAVIDACPNPANFHTRGAEGECGFEGGHAWMESTSTNLAAEFECVGQIYSGDNECEDDDVEQPMAAAATSLEEPWVSGANAGFLRPDALLVVVALTDEDEHRAGARAIYDRLVAIKGGDPKKVVFLGIGGSRFCFGTYGIALEASRVRDTAELFAEEGRGVFWDLCGGNLADGLTAAMSVIDTACEELLI